LIKRDEGLFKTILTSMDSGSVPSEMKSEIWRRFGRKCAMMVLDSSGFTSGAMNSGIISYLSCIVRLRQLIRPILEDHGCISCRFSTDNAYAEFRKPLEALEASRSIQHAVHASGIEVCDGCDFGVCIGIGYGDVLCSVSEGVYGDEMNLASKLGEDLAGKGEILMTESAFREVPETGRTGFEEMKASISGVEFPYYRLMVPCT
jgi:class 3 adenylate cyclase